MKKKNKSGKTKTSNGTKKSNGCIFEGKKCMNSGKFSICNKCLHFMILKGKDFIDYDCKFEPIPIISIS